MDRKTARALDRWITDDAQDYGAADAPDPTPTPDAAAIDAAARNELATRRAALAARLLTIDAHAWLDFADAASQFDLHRSHRTAEHLAELLIDLTDGAL
jgi:hypothetical protein